MRARLTRIAVSFGTVLSVYLVYALIVVRLIEPSVNAAPKTTRSVSDYKAARDLSNQAALALRSYFPEGAWERQNPKQLGNDRVKLLFDDYTNLPDGRLKLTKCTMLFFEEPSPNKPKAPPVIMQAPNGAILKFDEDFDLKRAKIGRLVGGEMNGKVTISRQPSRPGAADDLLIKTRDVKLIEDRVVTPEVVDFRFGASYGSGREMTILLNRENPPGKPSKTPSISGVKSLTLAREVTVHMISSPDDDGPLSPGGAAFPAGAATNAAGQSEPTPPVAQGTPQPPVKITCKGPFRFDVDQSLATFNEKVDVFRLNASGPSDEMNCELLAIHFVRRDEAAKAPGAKTSARNSSGGPTALEARWIEARGDPVIIRAPSQGAQVRGQRVEYDLKTGRIVVDGPGTLQGASPRNPSSRYAAQWSHQLRVEPLVGEQLVTLLGGAKVSLADMGKGSADGAPQSGTLWADEIRAWLASAPPAVATAAPPGAAGAPKASGQRAAVAGAARGPSVQPATMRKPAAGLASPAPSEREEIRPKRVLAQGAVRVESPQLVGATGQLDAIFVAMPPTVGGGEAGSEAGGAANTAAPGSRQPTARSEQQFRVAGSKMEIHLAVRGPQTAVSELFLDGKALLVEAKTAKPEDKPLVVTGDRLEVFRADVPDTKIVVIGKPGKVEARGLTLAGPEIQMERATNLLWIDGPGRMTGPAPVDQTPAAEARAKTRPADPEILEVTWTGRMQFDGHTAHFERSVVGRTASWLVRTETLDATLQRTIDFAHPPDPNGKAEPAALEQLVCSGGPRGRVEFENRSADENGLLASIDRMEAPDMALNRTTGGVDAHGPGWVSSVRRGAQAAAASRQNAGGGPQPKAKPVADKKPPGQGGSDPNALSYLMVQFARSISGNMYKREMTFANQVKCIYGPVLTWEAKLDVENPDQAGPDAMNLTTDALTVREAPGRQAGERGWLELETQGNTQADGMDITARAHRLTFSEQKSLMVLEGDGKSDASVFRQTTPGAARSTTTASRILFWPTTKRVEVDNGRFIDLGPMPSPARRDNKSTTK